MDDPRQPVHKVLGAAADRVAPAGGEEAGPELEDAREEVAELLRRRDWQADARGSAAESLAGVLCALRRAGHGGYIDLLDLYADAAEPVARADLDYVQRRVAREDLVETVVVGTVLGEAMFGALRRLAHIDASYRRFESPEDLSGQGQGQGQGQGEREGVGGADGDAPGAWTRDWPVVGRRAPLNERTPLAVMCGGRGPGVCSARRAPSGQGLADRLSG
ncbi:hypothetical protein SBADM41S_07390 [Streptomyces badius]